MKKIKIIEEGILDKNEMMNARGGEFVSQCTHLWAYFICVDYYDSCQGTNHKVKCSIYDSCTIINKRSCNSYDGTKGPGGIINAMRNDQG